MGRRTTQLIDCLDTKWLPFQHIPALKLGIPANGPLKSYCYKRLTYLSSKFQVTFQADLKSERTRSPASHDAQRDPGGGGAESRHPPGFLQCPEGERLLISNLVSMLVDTHVLSVVNFLTPNTLDSHTGGHTHPCCVFHEPEALAQVHQEIPQDRRQRKSG